MYILISLELTAQYKISGKEQEPTNHGASWREGVLNPSLHWFVAARATTRQLASYSFECRGDFKYRRRFSARATKLHIATI